MVLVTIRGGLIEPEYEAPSRTTVDEMLEVISNSLNVEFTRLTLWLDQKELQGVGTLANCTTSEAVSLRLTVEPLPGNPKCNIVVKFENNQHATGHVRIRETWMVEDLRSKISRHWGILTDSLTLFRHGRELTDYNPLSAYYITEGAEVEAKIKIPTR